MAANTMAAASKITPAETDPVKRPARGITKPKPISPALQELLGVKEIPRSPALKQIWAYMKGRPPVGRLISGSFLFKIQQTIFCTHAEFINLISSESNEVCNREDRRTIALEVVNLSMFACLVVFTSIAVAVLYFYDYQGYLIWRESLAQW